MVFNGKYSEGINLKNELCRLVIILGIPYSNCKDINIRAKE